MEPLGALIVMVAAGFAAYKFFFWVDAWIETLREPYRKYLSNVWNTSAVIVIGLLIIAGLLGGGGSGPMPGDY